MVATGGIMLTDANEAAYIVILPARFRTARKRWVELASYPKAKLMSSNHNPAVQKAGKHRAVLGYTLLVLVILNTWSSLMYTDGPTDTMPGPKPSAQVASLTL